METCMKIEITPHAKQRLLERFPNLKKEINHLIDFSVLFGEDGKAKFLLNREYEIIFVICKVGKKNQLRTVLTKDQYLTQNPKRASKKSFLSKDELEDIAKECCVALNFSCPNKKKRKDISKMMIERGMRSEQINEFWNIVMNMIYKKRN